jgi:site-specific DNA-cytosine methylase
VAGSSCVDFSNLNGNKPQSGESKETHDALIEYAKKFHPVIVIVENIDAAPWAKMESAWQAAGYAATHLKVDSKDYYVPQIRNRGYLVALNMAKVSLAGLQPQDLLAKWKSVMISFRRPASSHAIEFLLPKDDLRLQQLRRDIESAMLERNKSEWDRCKTRYSDYRVDNKLGLGRPMTNWQDGGNCKVPGFFWAKWAKGQVERIWDTLDINLLRGIVKNRDSRYVAYV